MENQTQEIISQVQPAPPTSDSPSAKWSKILLFILLGLVFIAGLVFAVIQIGKSKVTKQQLPIENPITSPSPVPTTMSPTINPTANWKIYESKTLSLLIKYPENLTLKVNDNNVVLNHNIPYENQGACDMSSSMDHFSTLDDFNVTFSVLEEPNLPTGERTITIGDLKGEVILQGAEGCGDTLYYFKTPDNKTLLVKRANIQALLGIRGKFEVEEILKITGAISKEENERLFKLILSSLEFIKNNNFQPKTGWKHVVPDKSYEAIYHSIYIPQDWNLKTICSGEGGCGMTSAQSASTTPTTTITMGIFFNKTAEFEDINNYRDQSVVGISGSVIGKISQKQELKSGYFDKVYEYDFWVDKLQYEGKEYPAHERGVVLAIKGNYLVEFSLATSDINLTNEQKEILREIVRSFSF